MVRISKQFENKIRLVTKELFSFIVVTYQIASVYIYCATSHIVDSKKKFYKLTRLLVSGRSPECSDCPLRFMEQ